MLHGQTRFIYNFSTLVSEAAFLWLHLDLRVRHFRYFEAFPWITSLFPAWHFLLSRAFPWIRMFSAYVSFYCIGGASWVALFPGGKRCWEVCYIYHYRFAPSSIQHGAMGSLLRASYRYTNLRVGDCLTGLALCFVLACALVLVVAIF